MRHLLLVLAFLVLAPSAAVAQQSCELLPFPRARQAKRVIDVRGNETIYISGPARFACTGQITVEADSAVMLRGSGRLELVGDVFYGDTAKTLTAERVDYFGNDGRIFARGDVVLGDRKTGSEVRGEELEYFRASPARPESLVRVEGRPHATLYETGSTAGDTARSPLDVDADEMEIRGERYFLGRGRVELVRGEIRGRGQEVAYDQGTERMVLREDAEIEGDAFRLVGRLIEADVVDGALHHVHARDDVVLTGDEITLDAPVVRIFFEDGDVQRLVAMQGDSAAAQPQPQALAEGIRMTADSIDAVAPGQRLERVVAVGGAFGVQLGEAAGQAAALPEFARNNWMRGDTIVGHFAPATAAADSGQMLLQRLVAVGVRAPARSVYRVSDETRASTERTIDYIIASRITLRMTDGEVRSMEADGPVRGVHLQPVGPGAAPAEAPPDSGTIAAGRE